MLFFSTRTPKKYQGSPDQPSTAPTDAAQCAVGRKDAFSDWFALWSSSPEWFGRWTADGEIWRLGWSTKEPWQPWWFSPVFYERFRDLGRKHGDQMGSSWEIHGRWWDVLEPTPWSMSVFENGGPQYLDDYFIGKKWQNMINHSILGYLFPDNPCPIQDYPWKKNQFQRNVFLNS